jgi:PERQ amino acid-rich with GYF domain-containing protein
MLFRATENPSESGGSFDSSGAFHGGMYSDDDEDGVAGASQHGRTRRVSEGSASNVVKSNSKPSAIGTGSVQSLNRHMNNTATSTLSKERTKPLDSHENKDNSIGKERRSNSPTIKPTTVPSTESITTKTSTTSSDLLQKKIVGPANVDKVKPGEKSSEPPSGPHIKESAPTEVKMEPQITAATARQVSLEQSKPMHNTGTVSVRQRTEDDLDRMKEEADALVAKLMADEESHKEKSTSVSAPPAIGNQPTAVPSTGNQEKWFYRDPQGEVQGPFLANEMAEWCKAGYFTAGLLVRRTCDERYTTLGDLMKMCGRMPFTPGPPIPPLKVLIHFFYIYLLDVGMNSFLLKKK